MADLYTARSILKLVKFITFSMVVGASVALLGHLIGPENMGIVCTAGIGLYLAYHFVVTDADIERRMDELNAKFKKD